MQKRAYYDDLRFVMAFSYFPTAKYHEVGFFLDQVNASELLESDKAYFKTKTVTYCLERYFNFVIHRGGVEVPDLFQDGVEVSWKPFRATGFDRFFTVFRDKLMS